MAQRMVRAAEFIENSLFALVVGARIQFCGYHRRQNGALKDPGIFAQPKVILSSTEPDVNTRIEQKETVRSRHKNGSEGLRQR